jgi:hypothetical protein
MPADISVDFQEYVHAGYRLLLIKDPLQSHVVNWEAEARKLKNDDAKPMLNQIMVEFKKIQVGQSTLNDVVNVFVTVSEIIKGVIKILDDNETLTLSSNRGVMVKAALNTGWILSLERLPRQEDKESVQIMKTAEEVDTQKPWLVHWVAECVGKIYLEATTIPKN